MKEYKESLWERTKWLLWGVGAALFLFFILRVFVSNLYVVLGVPGAIILWSLYRCFLVARKRVILSEQLLEVYHGKKCKHSVVLSEVMLDFYMCSSTDAAGTDHDLRLYVCEQSEGEKQTLDMSFLGRTRFEKLLVDLGIYDPDQPIRVETSQKNK